MLKAKALCAVNGNVAPKIRPLMSAVEAPAQAADTHGNGLHDLISGMQNIVIESVGGDEKIPETVGQLAIRMMKNNVVIKDLLHELRQLYIRGQKDFRLSLAGRSDAEKKQIISLFQDMAGLVSNVRYFSEFQFLNGSLVVMPKAQMFLTGQYLELAVYRTIKEVLQELSVKYQAEYEIYRNVRVADRESKLKNEFDLLLVDSYIFDNKAECIQYFCDYYVCNLSANTLQEKVTKMVINDLTA